MRNTGKTETKKTVAKEIIKRLNVDSEAVAAIYKRGLFDFARFVHAGGAWAEIKEMMQTDKLPQGMRAKRQKPENRPA